MIKLIAYGVRPNEVEYFKQLNKYNFDLTLVEGLLTDDNLESVKGQDAVLLRANCKGDRQALEYMKEAGINYVFTRTVGYSHIDLDAARDLNIKVARVPRYSPNAIAELAVMLAMNLLRNLPFTLDRTKEKDLRVSPEMFSREIRNCTVGVYGTGKIGLTEAKLFKGLGAKVLGFDLYPSEAAKEVVEFVSAEELLKNSDIVSMHIPHIPNENDGMINEDFLSQMKDDAILINTARGELQDNVAIIKAIKNGALRGFGTDVMPNEQDVFFKKFTDENPLPDKSVEDLLSLYPRVLVTPHIGSNTDEALSNMIETSFKNFYEVIETGQCDNLV
ncbi:2-hydroxyacid dehydrogenase [Jeotgalicoccus sp. ATCC 8456]|uniref:2-hydroxyacid dehydrogenase n=1 Tax=Jeotgalicoccus sp. ATCC 8456 TaxID=946435 RepID=UPI0018E5F39C|nr:2-hydroxyacid dehydrogenase [Jeotgalicoccus sp. ATCC 8456]QQD85594.1 lactate dehydrogenase [Jeotgalicoccus sp. ATCC 8456]